MSLGAGLYPVPAGHLAAVITDFEMTARVMDDMPFPNGVTASKETVNLTAYRELFRAIGTPWLWTSRLLLNDEDLQKAIGDPKVETWIIRRDGDEIGLIELDFKTERQCELSFFGVIPSEMGQGLGKPMMAMAQSRAFAASIDRLYLHTCTLDSPRAVGFYQSSGFRAVSRTVQIFEDPRPTGLLPADTAPNQPAILEPSQVTPDDR